MAVMDELKKQLVQDLARYMIYENEPRDLMWKRLKVEHGWDCKLIWERTRILTIKKLSKMLAAEDRTESIPGIAQMTSNDWLVFDKILVHENIDVIGKDLILSGHPESKVLWELFILVSSYDIESLPPEDVAKGWYNLTKTYNTSGRCCSAMLLQLRWYQLKDLVRTNFHNFWSIYPGNTNFKTPITRATKLQKLIAKRYGNILTEPFISWENLINKKLVVLDRDLDNCSQLDQSETFTDDMDVIEIKPTVQTIDIGTDSESEDELKKRSFQFTTIEEKQCLSEITVNGGVIKNVDEQKTVENFKLTDEKFLKSKITEEDDQLFFLSHEIDRSEENYSTQIFDSKLLMLPICYIKKLDHIIMCNINLTIKSKHNISRIEAASKPMLMKSVEKNIGKMRQNLIKRNYSLKQLHKRPEFNVKLKNLSVNFFLNERNRRLFNNCRPVTVNLDRLIETKSDYNKTQKSNLLASTIRIIERIEAKNVRKQRIPHHNVKKATTDKIKYLIDVTDNSDSRQTKRKAIIFM